MNLRDFQTQMNEAAQQVYAQSGDNAPQVVVTSYSGAKDFVIEDVFVSSVDHKIVIRIHDR